ncbi:carbohydrate sulfotransferase 11-like isoform X1 [Lytechinus pictus]|uniref:carbohydrate sulfotransferase 11-like isoform X1 n=2 Tax=Lytechinus pictus TaxID=7653 RepID=UPI0030B9D853
MNDGEGQRIREEPAMNSKTSLDDFDSLSMKRYMLRWCALCMVAMVMIVAWEMGFYVASITEGRGSLPKYHTNRRHVSLSEKEDPKVIIEREQSERRSNLKKECELAEMDSNTVSEYTIKHMLVVEDYELVYCFIPKVGCSNWKRILMVLDNQTDSVQGLTSDEVHINGKFKFLSTYGQEERTRILKDYNKFFFVRHPFERILSVFKNKLENLKNYRKNRHFHRFGREMIKRWRSSASQAELLTGENATWSEFLQYLTHTQRRRKFEMSDVYFSDHWTEMYKICSPCTVEYDFIGLLENVAEESKYFLDKLGVGRKVQYLGSETSRPTNSSERSVYEKYYSQLSHEDLVKLWEIYKYDFQFFGYPKPWFVPDL